METIKFEVPYDDVGFLADGKPLNYKMTRELEIPLDTSILDLIIEGIQKHVAETNCKPQMLFVSPHTFLRAASVLMKGDVHFSGIPELVVMDVPVRVVCGSEAYAYSPTTFNMLLRYAWQQKKAQDEANRLRDAAIGALEKLGAPKDLVEKLSGECDCPDCQSKKAESGDKSKKPGVQ